MYNTYLFFCPWFISAHIVIFKSFHIFTNESVSFFSEQHMIVKVMLAGIAYSEFTLTKTCECDLILECRKFLSHIKVKINLS